MKPNTAASCLAAGVLLVGAVTLHARQLHLEQGFVFDNVRQGQILSGNVSIIARDVTGLDMVEIWLDGKRYSSGTDRQSGSHFSVAFGIPTGVYANGPHELELRLGPRVFDRRRVYFYNAKRRDPGKEPPP